MDKSRKLLVIGGGIAGVTAAVESSESGIDVVLVEKEPFLGGRVAQMNRYFPKLCPPTCGLEINFRRFRQNGRIQYLPLSRVTHIEGDAGRFSVTIERSPRFVNGRCTSCGNCVSVCPIERTDPYNYGLRTTKAVYLPSPTAFPPVYAIDSKVCPGTECGKCIDSCPVDAIDLTMQPERFELEVGAIVVATGWDPYPAEKLEGLGYGLLPDVITNVQLERIASQDGPTGGQILRRSNQKPVQSAAFVQCAGSRDENHLRHCSSVCCMASLKQVRYIREKNPDARVYLFYIDIRSPGRLEDFYLESQKDEKLKLVKGKVGKVYSSQSGSQVIVEAEDVLSGRRIQQPVDLVVLATGMVPHPPRLNGNLTGDENGFLMLDDGESGIFSVGCIRRPVGVAEAVRDATAATLKALQVLRG